MERIENGGKRTVNEKLLKNIHKHYQLHIFFLSVEIGARFNRKHLVDHEIIYSWKSECPVSCFCNI